MAEGGDGAVVGVFADMPVARSGGGDGDAIAEASRVDESGEHDGGHGRPADVAGADEAHAERGIAGVGLPIRCHGSILGDRGSMHDHGSAEKRARLLHRRRAERVVHSSGIVPAGERYFGEGGRSGTEPGG